jgi:hypothetical protein
MSNKGKFIYEKKDNVACFNEVRDRMCFLENSITNRIEELDVIYKHGPYEGIEYDPTTEMTYLKQLVNKINAISDLTSIKVKKEYNFDASAFFDE